MRLAAALLALALAAPLHAAQPQPLRVVSAAPSGEVADLAEANEIRVVFSESMIALGRVPPTTKPAFIRITPAVDGTYRWSGTTILIFTPSKPLPLATTYTVTVAGTAAALSGRRLGADYTFTFTTPTVKLLNTSWYRRGGRYDAPMIVLLRFNQPVNAPDVLAHVNASFQPHDWNEPILAADARTRLNAMNPEAVAAFDAKIRTASAAASASAPVALKLTTDWDKKQFPASNDLVAFETTTTVPPQSWVKLAVDADVPSPAGPARPGREQTYTIEAEPAFFIDNTQCTQACDPDRWNPVRLRVPVKATAFAAATRATDITDAARERAVPKAAQPKPRESWQLDADTALTVEDAGFDAQPPAHTWAINVAANLQATDGQTLGYTWLGLVHNWHRRAFTSFGDGDGVWETGGGATLPFYSRNFQNAKQWAAPVEPASLMPTLRRLRDARFHLAPPTPAVDRALGGAPDAVLSHGLDMSGALNPNGTGLVWAAVEEGQPIPQASVERGANDTPIRRASLVQVTNLGISVKDSPQNTLIFVTRLDNAAPVADARVTIVKLDGQPFWTGDTGADGIAMAPGTRIRNPDRWWEFAFIVTAEKDGDIAYAGSDWNEGVLGWDFGVPFSLDEADPLLRGSVFTDRGVYRLGEEVHFKAILRHNGPDGVALLPPGTQIAVTIRDTRNRVVSDRVVALNAWSAAEWALTLPEDGALGHYSIRLVRESDRQAAAAKRAAAANRPLQPGDEESPYDDGVDWHQQVHGSFLVAAYRRPDFRVDVTLTGDPLIAGSTLTGTVDARYLFGAAMANRPVKWTFTRSAVYGAPKSVTEKYPDDQWEFVGWREEDTHPSRGQVAADEANVNAKGTLLLDLETAIDAGIPYSYTLEGDVEDVSRQHIANRASLVVHPAKWYIGVKRPSYFTEQEAGLDTELVAVGLDGTPAAGVPIDVTLTQVQWQSVRRAEGNGFYTWESERKEVPSGQWHVTSALDPVALHVPLPAGGYFILEASAKGEGSRSTVTRTSFYALGRGYTAWARHDHNRIDLVPERQTYKPGDTARIMIQSPWERATALLTTEREGVRTHRQFTLTSTQQSIEVPITEADIPNLYVSVLLVKGRTKPAADGKRATREDDPSDPGKPSFRLGYVQLQVEDAAKRLTVAVAANRQEYRPANKATVTVDVKDQRGRGSASEVTLWAVDYGVLSLTNFRTPDILSSVYVHKALGVLNEDTRQRIVSRRVLTPKGSTDGGGGGVGAASPSSIRRDFRVLAFWLGSATTDANGHASREIELPESLTTYRIMAVAGDRASRFGSGDAEIRINKPVTLQPSFPRFMAVGDKAYFGAVVTNQLKTPGTATVSMTSLDPELLQFAGEPQKVEVPAGGSVEVRFNAAGLAIGSARVRVTVTLGNESDAFEDRIPVEVLVSPETVSAIGEADATNAVATEHLALPEDVVAGFGGLHVELASTALAGLGEGARYLVEYPYGCAEQRGSRALALLLTADLGGAFHLPGVDAARLKPTVQSALRELETFQCENGGFAYWPGACWSVSPYLTAYLLHVFQVAADLDYDVDRGMRERAYTYLEQKLAEPPPTNEGWWPSYTAWQAFAVKVLVEGGRRQDSAVTRLYSYRNRMPVFGLAYLHDALIAAGETSGPRVDDVRRRISNAILPEAAGAHVEELADPYLLWFWNSNVRSTAIVLNSLVRADAQTPYRALVEWLIQSRRDGRWRNTQENAMALEALVAYYRRREPTVPNFTASVAVGSTEIARGEFRGRSTDAQSADVPMSKLQSIGGSQPLTFTRSGDGTLFYSARLRYAADRLFQDGLDQGIRIRRAYAPYVENGTRPASTTFKAGDLVRVTLSVQLTKERRYVAVTDPLPAGFEPVESWFATTASSLAQRQDDQGSAGDDWFSWWQRGGFDHVERHNDRVELFAFRLSEGEHTFSYIIRATTAGTFRTAPAHAEEMYEPEVFGRTATATVTVER